MGQVGSLATRPGLAGIPDYSRPPFLMAFSSRWTIWRREGPNISTMRKEKIGTVARAKISVRTTSGLMPAESSRKRLMA